MRIGICGTQNNGKTSVVNAIKAYWPNYEIIDASYKKIVQEKQLPINQVSTVATQTIIRDALCDDIINNASKTHLITDRTVLDNVVYTLWLGGKDKIDDDKFIADSINICREMMKLYDIIFWLPLNEEIPLNEQKVNRDNSKEFREEIDAIFQAVYQGYLEQDGILFDVKNQPPMIPLTGNLDEKIDTIKEYFNEDGNLIETEQSVFKGLEEMYDEAALMQQLTKN